MSIKVEENMETLVNNGTNENIVENVNNTTNKTKINKKKAMSSDKASKVKKDGHTNEDDFAKLLPGSIVVPGTGKTDIEYKGYSFSLKKECKRIQMALYSIKSKNWINTSESAGKCKECLKIYPEKYEDYLIKKDEYKELLREKMVNLKEHLSVKENLYEFLNLIIFKNGDVDFLVMKDKNLQYIYHSTDVLKILLDNVEISNSQALKVGNVPEQKVIIKSQNKKNKLTNLIEIEIRNSSKQHYAQMLCVCNRDNLFELLNNNIEETIEQNNLVLKGNAKILASEI